MRTHIFDERGICKVCGISRSFADRYGAACETAEERAREDLLRQTERRRQTLNKRYKIPIRKRIFALFLMHACALVLPLAGVFAMYLYIGGFQELDSFYEGTNYVGPGFHPGAKWGFLLFLVGMIGVALITIPAWLAGAMFAVILRYLGVLPLIILCAALWVVLHGSGYDFQDALRENANPLNLLIALVLVSWASGGLSSVFGDILELRSNSEPRLIEDIARGEFWSRQP